jgi:hypothetical protein
MATTFNVRRPVRALTEDMFADLGYPIVSFTYNEADTSWDVSLADTLTPAQIIRAKIRLRTRNTADELMLVNALTTVSADLDTIANSTGTLSAANLSLAVRALAVDVKGIIAWIGKDVTG